MVGLSLKGVKSQIIDQVERDLWSIHARGGPMFIYLVKGILYRNGVAKIKRHVEDRLELGTEWTGNT